MGKEIDKKYLAGLKFRSSKPEKVDGVIKHQRFERPLEPGDVLNWRDAGDVVIIATMDGSKYAVPKDKQKEKQA